MPNFSDVWGDVRRRLAEMSRGPITKALEEELLAEAQRFAEERLALVQAGVMSPREMRDEIIRAVDFAASGSEAPPRPDALIHLDGTVEPLPAPPADPPASGLTLQGMPVVISPNVPAGQVLLVNDRFFAVSEAGYAALRDQMLRAPGGAVRARLPETSLVEHPAFRSALVGIQPKQPPAPSRFANLDLGSQSDE